MVKKILTGSLLFITFFLIGGAVFAQEDAVLADPPTIEEFEDIQEPLLSPDSPFYFLRQWQEGVERFLTRSEEAHANLELKHAQRRVGEMKHLARVNKKELLERTQERWQNHIQKAQERAERVSEQREVVRERVLEATSKHLAVLEKVYEQAPEEAKEGLQRAIDNAKQHQQTILERFSQDEIETLRENLKTKFDRFSEKYNLSGERFKDILPKPEGEE